MLTLLFLHINLKLLVEYYCDRKGGEMVVNCGCRREGWGEVGWGGREGGEGRMGEVS